MSSEQYFSYINDEIKFTNQSNGKKARTHHISVLIDCQSKTGNGG